MSRIKPDRACMEGPGESSQESETPHDEVPTATSPSPNTPSLLPPRESSNLQYPASVAPHKRSRSPEDDERPPHTKDMRAPKRLRTSLPSVSLPLTKVNLRRHNMVMNSEDGDSDRGRGAKRPVSQTRSIFTSSYICETTSTRTHTSSSTAARYRFDVLAKAKIYIHPTPTPDHIRTRIDAVIQRELDPERKEQLSRTAQTLSADFAIKLGTAAGEDDWIEPFNTVLSSMDYNGRFSFTRKADWEADLKPVIQRPKWNLSLLHPQHVDRTSKRQKEDDASYISPAISGSDTTDAMDDAELMPPPAPPTRRRVRPAIKTPRPDISIGLCNASVNNALLSQGLTNIEIDGFLEYLQDPVHQGRDGPILISAPSQRAGLNLHFPFLVVEGKSYATGNPIFDAQNQSAVSGASALNILRILDDLAHKAEPGSCSEHYPVVFSICTQGPYYELWGYYMTMVYQTLNYNMALLRTCNGALSDELARFLLAVENVMAWGGGEFLDDIAKKLGAVAKAMR